MQQLDVLVRMFIDDTEKLLYLMAISIVEAFSVRKILEAGLRSASLAGCALSIVCCYSLLEVLWQEMRNVVELRQMQFLTADGTSFLRMHEPISTRQKYWRNVFAGRWPS